MAQPNRPKARPASDNRAQMVTIGERPEAVPFDIEALEASVVPTNAPAFAMEGSFEEAQSENATEPAKPAEAPQGQAPAAQEVAPVETDEIDDPRFKGKGKKAVYEAFRNSERLIGEHSAEVATYRKLYEEQILKPQIEARIKGQQPEQQPVNPQDDTALLNEMLTSPTKFAKKLRDDAKRELMEDLVSKANAATVQQAKSSQQEIIASPEFRTWLVSNVPQHLAVQADNDPATLQFVLNSYKAFKPTAEASQEPSAEQTASANPVPPTRPLPANVDRRIPVGNAVGVSAASRTSPAPAFTLGQLAQMQLHRPDEYARRQPEIMAWYQSQQSKKS